MNQQPPLSSQHSLYQDQMFHPPPISVGASVTPGSPPFDGSLGGGEQVQGHTSPQLSTPGNISMSFQTAAAYTESPYHVPSMGSRYPLSDQSPAQQLFSSPGAEVPTSPSNVGSHGIGGYHSTLYSSPPRPSLIQLQHHSQPFASPQSFQVAAQAAYASSQQSEQQQQHQAQQYQQQPLPLSSTQAFIFNDGQSVARPLENSMIKKRGREWTRIEALDQELDRIEQAQLEHELALRAQYERFMEEQYQLQQRQQQIQHRQQQQYHKMSQTQQQHQQQNQQPYAPQHVQRVLSSFVAAGSTSVVGGGVAASSAPPVSTVLQVPGMAMLPSHQHQQQQSNNDVSVPSMQATASSTLPAVTSPVSEVPTSVGHAGMFPISSGHSTEFGSHHEFAPQSQLPMTEATPALLQQQQQPTQQVYKIPPDQQHDPLLPVIARNDLHLPSIPTNVAQEISPPQQQQQQQQRSSLDVWSQAPPLPKQASIPQPQSQPGLHPQPQLQQQSQQKQTLQSQGQQATHFPSLQQQPRVFIPTFPKWPSASSRYGTDKAEAEDSTTTKGTSSKGGDAKDTTAEKNKQSAHDPSSSTDSNGGVNNGTGATTTDKEKTQDGAPSETSQKSPRKGNLKRGTQTRFIHQSVSPHAIHSSSARLGSSTALHNDGGYPQQQQHQHPISAIAQQKSEQLLKEILLHDLGLYWPGTGALNLRPDGNSWDPQLEVTSWEQAREQDRLTIIPTHENELLKLPFPNEVDRLINIYYENEHTLPPIIHKVMIEKARKTLNHMYSRLLLNTIFGIAAKFDAIRKDKEGTVASTTATTFGSKDNDGFTQYFNRAYGLLRLSENNYMVYSARLVQVKMLLFFSFPIPTMSDVIPPLDRDVLFLGMHEDCSKWITRPVLRSYRLWTFWICFLLDSVQNVMKGNLSSIDEAFIKTELPVLTDLEHDNYHWTRRFLVNEIKLWRLGRQCYEQFEGAMDALEMLSNAVEDERDAMIMTVRVSEMNGVASSGDSAATFSPPSSALSYNERRLGTGTQHALGTAASASIGGGSLPRRSANAIAQDKSRFWKSAFDREAGEIRLMMLLQKWRDELPSQLWADLEAEEIVAGEPAMAMVSPPSSVPSTGSTLSSGSSGGVSMSDGGGELGSFSNNPQQQQAPPMTMMGGSDLDPETELRMRAAARRSVNGRAIGLEIVLSLLKILLWYHYIHAIGPALDDLVACVEKEEQEEADQRRLGDDWERRKQRLHHVPQWEGDSFGSANGNDKWKSRRILELYQSRIQQTVREADRLVMLGEILLQHYPERAATCCLGKGLDWALRVYHKVGLEGAAVILEPAFAPSSSAAGDSNMVDEFMAEKPHLQQQQHQQQMDVEIRGQQQGHGGNSHNGNVTAATLAVPSSSTARSNKRRILSAEMKAQCRKQALRIGPLLKRYQNLGNQHYWSWLLAEHESLVQEKAEDQERMIQQVREFQAKLKEQQQQHPQHRHAFINGGPTLLPDSMNMMEDDAAISSGTSGTTMLGEDFIEKEKRKVHSLEMLRKRMDHSRQILQQQPH